MTTTTSPPATAPTDTAPTATEPTTTAPTTTAPTTTGPTTIEPERTGPRIRPGVQAPSGGRRMFVGDGFRGPLNSIETPFWERVYNGELPYVQFAEIRRQMAPIDILGPEFEIVASYSTVSEIIVVAGHADAQLLVRAGTKRVDVTVIARTPDLLASIVADLEAFDPGPDASQLELVIWSSGSYHPNAKRTTIDALDLGDSIGNYPGEVGESLTELAEQGRPAPGSGRLILFHGRPGTGKTTAIRLLATRWKEWCRLQYVSDPEQLFTSGEYLVALASHQERPDDAPSMTTTVEEQVLWNLLVIEDGDLWMTGEARKAEGGGGFQRLLNLTDGIIGQANNLIILLSANVGDHDVDTALRRPGRCLADIDFRAFTEGEARRWLRDRDGDASTADLSGDQTLAELLAREGSLHRIGGPADAGAPGQYL